MKREQYLESQVSAANQRAIAALIGKLQAFKVGNVKALWFPTSLAVPTGKLSPGHAAQLRGTGSGDRPVYVIFSYSTPIAWRCAGDQERGGWVVPKVKYSPTTSHHQAIAAVGMARWDSTLERAQREVFGR